LLERVLVQPLQAKEFFTLAVEEVQVFQLVV
jgi:hypothetical protein